MKDGVNIILEKRAKQVGVYNSKCRLLLDFLFGNNRFFYGKHFKFDFSLSSHSKERVLRFSVNGFGERKNFQKKVLKVFEIFKNQTELIVIEQLIRLLDPGSLTLGLSWGKKQLAPTLKIESEIRCARGYSEIGKVLHIKNSQGKEILPSALSVIFDCTGKISLKKYFDSRMISERVAFCFPRKGGELKNEKYFFLYAKRMILAGETTGQKKYLVFESGNSLTPKFINERWNYFESIKYLSTADDNFLDWARKRCQKSGSALYPTIIGAENTGKQCKYTYYFSIR